MGTQAFNYANFISQFPAFANGATYPEATLAGYWAMGTSYISTNNGGCVWNTAQGQLANDLMAAHLAQSYTLINNGVPSVLVQGSTQGSVTVSLTPPPVKSAYGWWLSTTPYGAQLRALLKTRANIGFYAGGLPERASFRKVGGVW